MTQECEDWKTCSDIRNRTGSVIKGGGKVIVCQEQDSKSVQYIGLKL